MEQFKFDKKELIIGIFIKVIAIASSIYGMILSIHDLMSLTFFTNLSNIMIDIILGIFLGLDIILLKSNGKNNLKNNFLFIVKFLLTISITLTFLVFLFILAPTNEGGILDSYLSHGCGSLCVHFITPLCAIIDFVLFDYEYESTGKHTIYGVIPPLCYVAFIIILGMNGVRWYGNMYAPYNFINYGADTGWFGFDLRKMGPDSLGIGVFYMIIVLVMIFIGIGKCFLFAKNFRRKVKLNERKLHK